VIVGVFGSAFNPPTRGHLDAIYQGLSVCDEVWLVPSIAHAFGKDMLPFSVRWQMLNAFAMDINEPSVKACDIERELWDGEGPVYTYDVMLGLQSRFPEHKFLFLCGPDNAQRFSEFAFHQQIRERWGVYPLKENLPTRSTIVRRMVGARDPINDLVTSRVHHIIEQRQLYV
jgi:nicotinate-nucleotide adenylyltransferase